jgi:hypothetical protein
MIPTKIWPLAFSHVDVTLIRFFWAPEKSTTSCSFYPSNNIQSDLRSFGIRSFRVENRNETTGNCAGGTCGGRDDSASQGVTQPNIGCPFMLYSNTLAAVEFNSKIHM